MSSIDILTIFSSVVAVNVSIVAWDSAINKKMPAWCAIPHAFNKVIVLYLRCVRLFIGCLILLYCYIDIKLIDWTMGTEYTPLTSCVYRNGKKVVVTSDPEFVKHALPMGRKVSMGDDVRPLKRKVAQIEGVSGENFSESEWRKAFETVRTTFQEKNIHGIVEKNATFCRRYINKLTELVNGGKREFDLNSDLRAASIDTMMHAVYGMDLRTVDDDDRPLYDDLEFLETPPELLSWRRLRQYLADSPEHDLFEKPEAMAAFEDIGYAVIDRLQSEEEPTPRDGSCPFLKKYINRPGYYRDVDDEMGVTMATLTVLAGADTMAFALYVTLYLLARNPDKQKIMRDEVTRVLTGKSELTFEDLEQLKYVEGVILESLRLFPPKGTLTRYASKSTICGIPLKDEDEIEINIWKMNLSHENFTAPWTFLPERFTDPQLRREQKLQNFLAFGSDPCLGKDLAMNTMKNFLASFILSFKVERVARTPSLFYLPENRVTSDHFSRRNCFDKPLYIGLSLIDPDEADC